MYNFILLFLYSFIIIIMFIFLAQKYYCKAD